MLPNLVLGVARNYALATIAPFVASLRRAAPAAELCLFAAGMDEAFTGAAPVLGIRVEDPTPYDVLPYNPLIGRLFIYDGFLRQHGDHYANVLLTDVRDVVFQSDPFAPDRAAEVLFAVEDGLIRDSPLNMRWIAGVYGQAAAEAIGGNPILCAGTTLGTVAGVRRYLADMIQQVETMPYERHVNYDQGMQNYLAWTLRPPYAAADLERRVFRTIGLTARDRIQVDDITVTVEGRASPVLHQWDRHESLARLYATDPRFQIRLPETAPPSSPPRSADAEPEGHFVTDPRRPELDRNIHHGDVSSFVPDVWRYLVERFAVTSMLDVGCGEGHAVRFFHRLGVIAHGIDGLPRNIARAVFPIALHDILSGPYVMPVDLVWCCEVAEHILPEKVDHFLDTLANGKVIAMTRAQPPEYWIERLAARGYGLAAETEVLKRIAAAGPAFNFFQQSGLVFVRLR